MTTLSLTPARITEKAKALFREERQMAQLTGWFTIKELQRDYEPQVKDLDRVEAAGLTLKYVMEHLPITISSNSIFAGTQRDAFASSYALINPEFKVETFAGYCDVTEVFDYIKPDAKHTTEQIADIRDYVKNSAYGQALSDLYGSIEKETAEVAYFVEQVTGHVIPDFRPFLAKGVDAMLETVDARITECSADSKKSAHLRGMKASLEASLILADRYRALAARQAAEADNEEDRMVFGKIAETLAKVPASGCDTFYEAIQSFQILWQTMCVEQAPNPFAFSVGNADRVFEPYRAKENLSREEAAAMLKHLLVFYNVGDRSWAISQDLIVGGRDLAGNDMSNDTSYALMDAYYDMHLPQPILSVKLHKNTPEKMYRELGRFLFTPGHLTPSFFNDDSLFEVLRGRGIEEEDLPDYAIAGCQEPLIMGKDNGNTTNSWLNLAKILELTLNDGVSTLSGKEIGTYIPKQDALTLLTNIRENFAKNAAVYTRHMTEAANGASRAVALCPVPFLSTAMGGIETGYDMRDTVDQGTKYNGSGCLIHGVSVVADSFIAIDHLLAERPQDAERLLAALRANFEGYEDLRQYLLTCPKYGNNLTEVDEEAIRIIHMVSDLLDHEKNYLGNPFRSDYSSPSTHLLYGYLVGATPDGRPARDMLGYGLDPLAGDAASGLGFRTLSASKLPYERMGGGYASHYGIDPKYFRSETMEEKGIEFRSKVLNPLFFGRGQRKLSPFYLYVNITTAETLRKVLAEPEKYAPSGVYIMRIHGTFVNFLDLSPAIQEDIIRRLDPASTAIA